MQLINGQGETALPEELRHGNAEAFHYSITHLQLQAGDRISLPSSGITALVGGNNAGKSTVLRQISGWISQDSPNPWLGSPTLLTDLEVSTRGDSRDFAAWLRTHAEMRYTPGQEPSVRRTTSHELALGHAVRLFEGAAGPGRLGALSNLLVQLADARQRFNWTSPVPRRGSLDEPAHSPLHQFEDDFNSFQKLSEVSSHIFGQPLTMDHVGGSVIIRVGECTVSAPPIDRITTEYRHALGQLKPLNEQGDGLGSVMGLMIPVISSTFPVVLIDEPEAFLHPPQARKLGAALATLARERGVQIVLATHDRNLLTGILDDEACPLTVVRLSRNQDTTSARQLSVEELRLTWSDPVLRHTNVLDGLFHQRVVIAENERDCSFYAAACESAHTAAPLSVPPHDILFVSSSGKSGMARIASALTAVGVHVSASPDLDILGNEGELQTLVEALGAHWSLIKPFYDRATAEFRQSRRPQLNKDIQATIDGILGETPNSTYDRDVKARISAALAVDSPWRALKTFGHYAMRADREAAKELLRLLDLAGVVLVKVGELEGFGPDVNRKKGPSWLPAALASGAHKNPEVRDHIFRLIGAGMGSN